MDGRVSGGSGIGNVEVAARNVDLALARHNAPAAVREVCALLSNEAQTPIGNLPPPTTSSPTELNTAYMVGRRPPVTTATTAPPAMPSSWPGRPPSGRGC